MSLAIAIESFMFNSSGAIGPFSNLGHLLMKDIPEFGNGIEMLQINSYFKQTVDPTPGAELIQDYFEAFSAKLDDLPRYRFKRKERIFEVSFKSEISGDEIIDLYRKQMPDWRKPRNVELFIYFFHEVLEIIEGIKKRVKKSDNFDVEGLLRWIQSKEFELPKDGNQFHSYMTYVFSQMVTKTQIGWEDLAINWEVFHPNAKNILNEPFYWDCTDEYSPHGNDEGAEVLEAFQKWRKKNKTGTSSVFFKKLLAGWGLDDGGNDFGMRDEATIGLAFAHIKIDGGCPSEIREMALTALEHQLQNIDRYFEQPIAKQRIEKVRDKLLCAPEPVQQTGP